MAVYHSEREWVISLVPSVLLFPTDHHLCNVKVWLGVIKTITTKK